jgi:polygalacturonase
MISRRDALLTAAALAAAPATAAVPDDWAMARQIVARIKPPTFPDRDFLLEDFGGDPRGLVDNTEAFRRAIAACHDAGGGRVLVRAGDWLTGAIHLKSRVNLHLEAGAVVRFRTDPAAYLPMVFTRWEGVELMNYSPFVYAFEQEDIAITGQGVLDGQSSRDNWWPWKGPWASDGVHGWREGMPDQRPARARLFQMAEDRIPVAERRFGPGSYLRPNFIQPYRCKNVLIEGVKLRHSPMWQLHPVLCENVTIRGLDIASYGPNNDGCDPESCKDVLIEDCTFATGDDCIAINSGRNEDGRRVNVPCENLVIRNCRMADGHGGITIGSQISGHVRNVFAENCRLDSPNLDHAIRFKNNALRGGILEHIRYRNLQVGQVRHAVITVDFNYEEGANGRFTPVLRDVVIEKVTSTKSEFAVDLEGLPKAPAEAIRIADCDFRGVAKPSIVANVQGLSLQNVRVNGRVVASLTAGV